MDTLSNFINDAITTIEKKKIQLDHKKLADSIATEIKEVGPIDETYFEDYDTFHRQTYRFNHIVRTLNEKFGVNIPEMDLSGENHRAINYVRAGMSYIPLIKSYNELYYSAQKLPSEKDEDYWRFYKNLFLFASDFAFLHEKVAYGTAFKSTSMLASKLRLAKTQSVLGEKGYGLLLSEIYRLIRGEINKGWNDLIDALRNEKLL